MHLQIISTRNDLPLVAGLFICLFIYASYRVWAKRSASRRCSTTRSNGGTNEKVSSANAKERAPGGKFCGFAEAQVRPHHPAFHIHCACASRAHELLIFTLFPSV